jgi:Mn-containing catalase
VFFHTKQFQYNAKPNNPDPIFAKQMQELLGGQWGEISVMMTYLFQGWNCRGPAKYRDMLMDTATEEIGHVEMIATMIARLLETSPVEAEQAANDGGGWCRPGRQRHPGGHPGRDEPPARDRHGVGRCAA